MSNLQNLETQLRMHRSAINRVQVRKMFSDGVSYYTVNEKLKNGKIKPIDAIYPTYQEALACLPRDRDITHGEHIKRLKKQIKELQNANY